ncbi:uncharacterized protein LOC129731631 isoform X1 [Wyeomyia smithii]|uniref:uncharacterized protein LOC129731631 isoform X1 n=1 Tax=Wyeomyia smithii TaxID=174621 RepID=UPI00246802A5|nr:uncharacterized protein LOC129731631 isoform X1 [Wyeomyia smithii]
MNITKNLYQTNNKNIKNQRFQCCCHPLRRSIYIVSIVYRFNVRLKCISVGNVVVQAHREQLRLPKRTEVRQNITVPSRMFTKRGRAVSEDSSEDDFFGYDDELVESATKSKRSDDLPDEKEQSSLTLRRPERLKGNRKSYKQYK